MCSQKNGDAVAFRFSARYSPGGGGLSPRKAWIVAAALCQSGEYADLLFALSFASWQRETAARTAETNGARPPPMFSKRLYDRLRLENIGVNHKKVYRLYCEEKLKLRVKKGRRIKSEKRGVVEAPTAPNQLWTMDFMHDSLCDGRSFRTLSILDTYTRQCLHIEADTSLNGERVVRVLEGIIAQRGKPQVIRIDNGPEFRGQKLDVWAYKNQVKLDFIQPGKPTQNAHIESFNSKLRDECLEMEWFTSLRFARHEPSSKRGVSITILKGRTAASITYRPIFGHRNKLRNSQFQWDDVGEKTIAFSHKQV